MTESATLKLSNAQRLIATFGGGAVVVVLGVVTYFALSRAVDARELVGHTHTVIEQAAKTLSDLQDAETGQRGYLLTGEDKYLAPYRSALASIDADTSALRSLTIDNPVQGIHLDSLRTFVGAKFAELHETIDLRQKSGLAAALAVVETDRGKNAMDGIRSILLSIDTEESRLLAKRQAEEERLRNWVTIILLVGTVAAALVAMLVNTILSRYGAAQERAAESLAAQNTLLQEQALELELQHQQLHEQASELEVQNEQLQQQAVELEAQSSELQEQAAELEMTNDELTTSAQALAERALEAEQASASAEVARAEAVDARRHAESLQSSAEIANSAKSEFLAAMSHELRTPLNAITGYVDLLSMGVRGPVSETQQEDLRRIKKSGTHLLSLINEILNLARVEAGQVDLNISEVRITSLLDDVVLLVTPQMQNKGLTMSIVPCDSRLTVCADAERTQQVLLNLLTNSQKFTDRGGSVSIECVRGDVDGSPGMLCVRIADTGRGIPKEKLAAIFEPFVQIDRRLTPDGQQGVGLGLAISRDLARAMGGDLTVESELGRGSTFTLLLPTNNPPNNSQLVAGYELAAGS